MTNDDINRMAHKAGALSIHIPRHFYVTEEFLERFAALAIAAEREKILALADSLGWVSVDDIRARGDK